MNKPLLIILVSLVVSGGVIFYYLVDPASSQFVFKCPFHLLTGLDCPSCGTQRALHAVLHGNFTEALAFNPFLFISLPYLMLVIWGSISFLPGRIVMERIFHSRAAILIYLALLLFWWILRNVLSL